MNVTSLWVDVRKWAAPKARGSVVVVTMLALGSCSSSTDDDATPSVAASTTSSTVAAGSTMEATTTASTVASTVASTTVDVPAPLNGELPIGTATYAVQLPHAGPRLTMTATLPSGWEGFDGWVLRKNGGVTNRQGVAITLWAAPHYVYGDACQWADSTIEAEPTVDFMAEALAAQVGRDASTPRELSVGKHRVVELQLSVPDDLDLSTCDLYQGDPYFQSWASADGATARYHQGPGQRDLVRLVDIDGQLLIIDAATWPELPSAEHDEALALLDSMTFELASS